MKKIMFLCTANACRSQIAEGFAKKYSRGLIEVHSAGLMAAGLHWRAVSVMNELGIDISGQQSKEIDEMLIRQMDIVITLCSHAEELCPKTPAHVRRLYWPIRDPVATVGTEDFIMSDFRRARDEIEEKVRTLVKGLLLSG